MAELKVIRPKGAPRTAPNVCELAGCDADATHDQPVGYVQPDETVAIVHVRVCDEHTGGPFRYEDLPDYARSKHQLPPGPPAEVIRGEAAMAAPTPAKDFAVITDDELVGNVRARVAELEMTLARQRILLDEAKADPNEEPATIEDHEQNIASLEARLAVSRKHLDTAVKAAEKSAKAKSSDDS